jgi:DNA-binding CsgD family transcriptional regulator/Flp pilus assembly protein TadD
VNGLLERGRELDELDAQIERAAAGDGRLVVVEGPAGIGKSRLLAEARQRAEPAMRVLSARGSELEGEYAFGVVRQLFEGELAEPERRQALLAGAATPAAAVFGAPEGGAEGASFASLHGLFWLVLNLAEEGSLLLAVDDLHWCDRPSLLFLAYLARRLESQPVLLLAGLRDAEPGTDAALLAEIARDPAATSVRPGPLSDAAVAAILEDRLAAAPDAAFVAACRDSTGGNPLLVAQLVTALQSEAVRPDAAHVDRVRDIGPRAVSRTVLQRIARLPGDAAQVARAVAVLGDGAELPAVAALAGVEETSLADATRGLAHAEILRPELPVGFVHPLVRDAVYHELSPGERELEHARAAALLRERGAPVEHVAAQLLQTSPRGEAWVSELLWEAGRAAMQAGAADSAVAYLRRALDTAPPDADLDRLLFELGAAEALTTGPAAAEHLARAYDLLSSPEDRAAAAGLLGRALLFTGSTKEAASIARRAASELPDELEDLRKRLEAFEFMAILFGAPGPERLSGLRAYRKPPAGGAGSQMLAAMAAWEAVCTDGTAAESAELALAAVEGNEIWGADAELTPLAAMTALVVTDRPEVVEIWRRALAVSHRRGSLLAASSVHLWHGFSHLYRGDLVAAEESLRTADDEFVIWGHSAYAAAHSRSFMAHVLRERGRLAEALEWLERVGPVPAGTNAVGWWLAARAGLLISSGRGDEAVAVADELAAHCAAMPDPARLWWRSLKAEALDRAGRRDEAIEIAREELEITRAFGAPSSLARTLRVLGTLEGDEGLDRLREAVEVLDGSTARLEHAKAFAALGSALRRARKPTDAREPLRRALELADVCGADALAEHVRTELYATGTRPRREALSGVESLTPSERRVVDLAADGRTNREVAQELYVTPKTVEVHLTNAYRKLGIRSRRELEQALAAT